jgi:hypothetical protein
MSLKGNELLDKTKIFDEMIRRHQLEAYVRTWRNNPNESRLLLTMDNLKLSEPGPGPGALATAHKQILEKNKPKRGRAGAVSDIADARINLDPEPSEPTYTIEFEDDEKKDELLRVLKAGRGRCHVMVLPAEELGAGKTELVNWPLGWLEVN